MTFDAKVPGNLKKTQEWFADILTHPLDQDIPDKADEWISPSSRMNSNERIQIYREQYWWRLLGSLQETYPLITRLMGREAFNKKIAEPYLTKYPSNHWSINFVGNRLTQWVELEYWEADRQLILDAAAVDWAYTQNFFAPHYRSTGQIENAAKLQPHIELFALDYDLFSYRDKIHSEPERKKRYYHILWRDEKNILNYDEITRCQYLLLQQFKKGATIHSACEWLETQTELLEEASQNLTPWMHNWTLKQWLYYCD